MSRCRRIGGRRPSAAGDDRVQAVELFVRVEVDDEATASTGANDADLCRKDTAELGLEVLEVVAERPPLRFLWRLGSLSADELLGLAH